MGKEDTWSFGRDPQGKVESNSARLLREPDVRGPV